MTSRYRQFGRIVAVDASAVRGHRILADELALYPSAPTSPPVDLSVRFGPSPTSGARTRNPSLHVEHENGFTAHGVMASATYSFFDEALSHVTLDVHVARTSFRRALRRMADAQFADRLERIGMLYHEAALVPAMVFDPERAPIHASGLQAPDGGVTLFGGTGGVGKTSLELHLGRHSDYRFVADDVAVLDASGTVYPNLAYPKIYGYNAPSGSDLRRVVVAPRRPLDRVHWALHAARGGDKVRRRVSPADLFAGVATEGAPLRRYILLAREARPDVQIHPVEPAAAADMSAAILAAELSGLLRHLRWHAYNRALVGRRPVLRVDDLLTRWAAMYASAFDGAECLVARLPIQIEHGALLDAVSRELAL